MLSWPKHLYRIVRITTPSGVGQVLRPAQHDVLFYAFPSWPSGKLSSMMSWLLNVGIGWLLLLSPAVARPLIAPAPAVFNILDYGARASPTVSSQAAIQRAIEACARAGGGQVLVPAGTFATASIYLKSNIDLHLASGATLLALPDSTLYRNDKAGLLDAGDSFIPALVVAKDLTNIRLSGPGTIRGVPRFASVLVSAPDAYPGWTANAQRAGVDMHAPRVRDPKLSLVYISGCQNVTLQNIQVINSPNWSCHLQWSQDVTVRGVRISSSLERGANSDGLDIDGCKRVLVSNCIIRTGDDAICLKTTRQGGRSETCEDITVTNCILSSSSCALKIGTETNADFRRILFTNCTLSDSNRGLGIIVRDGAAVEHVVFSNIVLDCRRKPFFWWGNGEAFHFTVLKRKASSRVGHIAHVRISGLSGRVEGTSTITGFAGEGAAAYSSISEVELADIDLTMRPESERDTRASDGLSIQNAEQLGLRNVRLTWDAPTPQPNWRHGLALHTVRDFRIEQFERLGATPSLAALRLADTQRGWLAWPALAPAGPVYCQVAGAQTKELRIQAAGAKRLPQLAVEPAAHKAVTLLP